MRNDKEENGSWTALRLKKWNYKNCNPVLENVIHWCKSELTCEINILTSKNNSKGHRTEVTKGKNVYSLNAPFPHSWLKVAPGKGLGDVSDGKRRILCQVLTVKSSWPLCPLSCWVRQPYILRGFLYDGYCLKAR